LGQEIIDRISDRSMSGNLFSLIQNTQDALYVCRGIYHYGKFHYYCQQSQNWQEIPTWSALAKVNTFECFLVVWCIAGTVVIRYNCYSDNTGTCT